MTRLLRPRPSLLSVGAACLSLAALAVPSSATANCSGAQAAHDVGTTVAKALTAVDLAGIRDIGPPSSDAPDQPIFTVSPDGSAVALQVRQADLTTNRMCLAMIVIPLNQKVGSRVVDQGGEMIRLSLPILGRVASPSGIPAPITPRWFSDSRSFAFLKRVAGSTQIWLAARTGRKAVQLTHDVDDIDDFRLSGDGRTVVYAARPGLREARRQIEAERRSGFHYDQRFSPMAGAEPFVPAPVALRYFVLDLLTRKVRPATPSDKGLFDTPASLSGKLAWMAPNGFRTAAVRTLDEKTFPPATRLIVGDRGSHEIPCPSETCRDVSPPVWWSGSGDRVRYLRREGWANSITTVYEWSPGHSNAVALYRTADNLIECHPKGDHLYCLDEGSTTPRQLVEINLSSGQRQVIFDPNPGFRRFALGRTERLQYINAYGVECFADLVFPVGYRPGTRYPLIVVQYQTRGFLRGGTGDEVPIQVLANRGFAVLSMQNPSPWPLAPGATSPDAVDAALMRDFTGRRSVLSSIQTAISRLVDRGIVDRTRIGLTGLSDGSSTVQFAALNSDLFKAGSVSGCCWEPDQDAFAGSSIADLYARTGWPRMTDPNPGFWSKISISMQPERVRFPLLFQASDDEYLMAVSSFTALRQAGKPADMFVYSREHHIKWQPLHRLAIYRRNIAWFEFWLKGIVPLQGMERQEVLRWQHMTSRSGQQRSGQVGA